MIDLYVLLPRFFRDKDIFLNQEAVITTSYLFGGLYSNKTNLHRHYGGIQVQSSLIIIGIKGLLISSGRTETDFSFKLAINGVEVDGTDFTFPADSLDYEVDFYDVVVAENDIITLYCTDRTTENEDVYIELSYKIRIDEYQQTTIRNLMYCLDRQVEADKFLIENLAMMIDIDDCSGIYLPYLASFLGFSVVNEWSLEKKRQFLKALTKLYHTSGQKLAFEAILHFFSYHGVDVIELYKKQIYEIDDYSPLSSIVAYLKTFGLFWPGLITEPITLLGFYFPDNTIIVGMDANVVNRGMTSGSITVYLTVNGTVDLMRYVEIEAGQLEATTNIYYFPPLTVTASDLIGFYISPDSPGGGDSWLECHFDITYEVARYHAARVEIDTALSDEVKASLDTFRPVHVLIRYGDAMMHSEYDEMTMNLEDTFSGNAHPTLNEMLQLPQEDFEFSFECIVCAEVGA